MRASDGRWRLLLVGLVLPLLMITAASWTRETLAADPQLDVETEWRHVPGPDQERKHGEGAIIPENRAVLESINRWDILVGLASLGLLGLGLLLPGRVLDNRKQPAAAHKLWEQPVGWVTVKWRGAVNRAWESAPGWLPDIVLMGRDFLAGAGIELADATGLGLLRPSLARWGMEPDRGASGAYHLGRALGGLAAAAVGILEMIGGTGMMGGGAAGGALLSLPTGGAAMIPAAATVVAGAGVAAAGARTSYLGVRGALDGISDYVRFSKQAKDERHIWDYDTSNFGELGIKGVQREDIKKGLLYLNDKPTMDNTKPWPWNIRDLEVLRRIAQVAENWGVASWRYAKTNQGIRHFWNWERKLELGRMESRYKMLGKILRGKEDAFPPTAEGFRHFTETLQNVPSRPDVVRITVDDVTHYFLHGRDKSVWIIERGGRLDTAYLADTQRVMKKLKELKQLLRP